MLILKKPIELNSLKPLRTSWSLFGEKIAANYRFLLTDIKAEDLLHMAVTPPESDSEENSNNLVTVNFSPNYTNQLRSEMMNNWFNRILLIGTQNFTYQDEVYVTLLMQKMGITQTAEFINSVHKLYQTDKTAASLIKNYSAIGLEFHKAVQNISHVNARVQEKQAAQLTARYFLQEEIYRHLATAELTRTVYEYHKGVQGIYYEPASEDIILAEHLKMADMIQIAQLKSDYASGVCLPMLLYSDYSEQNTILQGEITEKKVLTQIVSAALLYVTDMIHRNLQSIVMTGQQQNPQLLRQCLSAVYHSLPAILVRAREQSRQKKWQQDGTYSNHLEQQIRDSSKQLYEYEVQLTTLFAKQYREAAMVPDQAAEQIAYCILQIQNVELKLAEYYNFIQAGGYASGQEPLSDHKIFNNEIIYYLHKKAYYLENSATMQITFADNKENIQFSSNTDSQMTFIKLQVMQIEKKHLALFENNIKKYLLRDESAMVMPDKDTDLELPTVYEDAGLGFAAKSEENHQEADIVYEGKLAETTIIYESNHTERVAENKTKTTESDTVFTDLALNPDTVSGVNALEQAVVYEGMSAEQGEIIEYAETVQPTSGQVNRKEQAILYKKVIQKQLNLLQSNSLVNRTSDDAAAMESKESVNLENTDREGHEQALQIQQDIQMKQFLDSVNEQNIKKQQALRSQVNINETVLQVRIDREAAKKNAVEMLENPQAVLSKMMEQADIVNRKETGQVLSKQEIKREAAKTQFTEPSQESELQAAIHKIELQNETAKFLDIDFRSGPEPDVSVVQADELQLIYKQNYRETEEEQEMHLQQKKMISEEQVKIIEKNLKNYVNGNITQKLTNTAMTELRKEIKITGEMMIPDLIQQNMQTQVASISERVYRRLERRLIEERQRRGY